MIHKVLKPRQILLLSLRSDGQACLYCKLSQTLTNTPLKSLAWVWSDCLCRENVLAESLRSKELWQMLGCCFKPVLKECTTFKPPSVCTHPPGQNKQLLLLKDFSAKLDSWSRYVSCKAQADHHTLTSKSFSISKPFLNIVLLYLKKYKAGIWRTWSIICYLKQSTTTDFSDRSCKKKKKILFQTLHICLLKALKI